MFITDEKHHNTQFLANLSCDEKSICIPLPNKICNSAKEDTLNLMKKLKVYNCKGDKSIPPHVLV
jgi:hypothetical protein